MMLNIIRFCPDLVVLTWDRVSDCSVGLAFMILLHARCCIMTENEVVIE
jgi:hypothetical protein